MNIQSNNEFGKLKAVVVGRAFGANWPTDDPAFNSYWKYQPLGKGTKFPYVVPEELSNEIEEMLWSIIDTFREMNIEVVRPKKEDRIKRLEMEVSNLEFQISELREIIDHLNDRISD